MKPVAVLGPLMATAVQVAVLAVAEKPAAAAAAVGSVGSGCSEYPLHDHTFLRASATSMRTLLDSVRTSRRWHRQRSPYLGHSAGKNVEGDLFDSG